MQTKQVKILRVVATAAIAIAIILNLSLYRSRQNTIYIGTKNLTEQQIIANVYKQVIEANTDYKVKIISGLDTTSFVQNALESGDIDMYVEYTSSAYLEVFKHEYHNQSRAQIVSTLKNDYIKDGLELNSLLGFENSNAIMCNQYCANINSISDLDGKSFTFAAPAYFFERSDGYNLLSDKYDFSKVKIIKADPIVIYQGIISGQIDVGLGFTTDAKLARNDIKVLKDEDLIFPTYDAMLVTSDNFKSKSPKVEEQISKVNGTIKTTEIQDLNNQVENQKISVEEVAHSYAQAKGYIKDTIH